MSAPKLFATEAELVAKFGEIIAGRNANPRLPTWTPYHETAGWDVLLVAEDGTQIGVEAKLSLNAKVLDQALPSKWSDGEGPDFRAVLVPTDSVQHHLDRLARHVGVVVMRIGHCHGDRWDCRPGPPDLNSRWDLADWPHWAPAKRCVLPDYVPDVTGGRASPVTLSLWKVKAIKLLILLERRGAVTRADMRALQISPTRWTDHFNGFLTAGPNGFVRNHRTPDLKAQHPTNWAQIEADFDAWSVGVDTVAKLGLEAA